MNDYRLKVVRAGTHHINARGEPAYEARFDEVLSFHPPGLAAVRRGQFAWHIRPDASDAYERRFARTFGYYENLAAVTASDGWHHIDVEGNDSYPERHAWCGNFQAGRCSVRDGAGRYHHIHPDGSAAYSERWHYAGDYRDGIAVVQAADGRSTHIDGNGQLVHRAWFLDLDVFHKGYARARDNGGWSHIDGGGRPIYARRFAAIEPFYNGQARVERFDGALEVINESGATLVELRSPRRSEFAALSADMVGFWRTQVIAAAVSLSVAEALPATEAVVADHCGLRTDATTRLLRALGELGLTLQEAGTWRLTRRGEFLRRGHSQTLADAALEYAGPIFQLWQRLPDALRRDSNWMPPDVFGDVAKDASRRITHHRMLRSYALHDYAGFGRALELRGDEHVIDAGGGLGVFAKLVLDVYPSVQVTILERPEVVAQAESVSQRLRWHSADLFEPWGIQADAVLLSRVLHDWDDEYACRILDRARSALPLGGRIYIVEMLLHQDNNEGALCDLHLLVTNGGRERTAEEFARLLAITGFRFEGVRTMSALPSLLLGVAV